MIVAGGTGGHLFPGIALGEALKSRGREVMFVSGMRKVEEYIFSQNGITPLKLDVEGFVGRRVFNKFQAGYKLIKAVFRAMKIIKGYDPDVVFATGGYVSVPVIAAARLLNKVTGLHEQNSIPGVANRVLGKMVDRVFVSIKGSESWFPQEKVVFSGNPVRESLIKSLSSRREKKGLGLLILGGSQGARAINELALEVVPDLLEEFKELRVIHQTGMDHYERVLEDYKKRLKVFDRLEVFPFIKDMGWAYSQADLVISRSGATTLAELFAAGLPAIFIPFPYATHDHQKKNAEAVVKQGGALLFLEREVTPQELKKTVTELLSSPERLKKMAKAMKSMFVPNASEIIIDNMERLVKNA